MSVFTEAYQLGVDAGQKALENTHEIDVVFQELDDDISTNTGGKVHIVRESKTRTRRVRRPRSTMDDVLGLHAPQSYYDEEIPYHAIVAKNAKSAFEIAEYDMSETGYPIAIKWSNKEENCWDKTALTETLKELLSDPNTGKVMIQLLSGQLSEN